MTFFDSTVSILNERENEFLMLLRHMLKVDKRKQQQVETWSINNKPAYALYSLVMIFHLLCEFCSKTFEFIQGWVRI